MTHDDAYMVPVWGDRPWIAAPIGEGVDGQQRAMWPVLTAGEAELVRRLRLVEAERDALATRLDDWVAQEIGRAA